jgi:hypothetical protein
MVLTLEREGFIRKLSPAHDSFWGYRVRKSCPDLDGQVAHAEFWNPPPGAQTIVFQLACLCSAGCWPCTLMWRAACLPRVWRLHDEGNTLAAGWDESEIDLWRAPQNRRPQQ